MVVNIYGTQIQPLSNDDLRCNLFPLLAIAELEVLVVSTDIKAFDECMHSM